MKELTNLNFDIKETDQILDDVSAIIQQSQTIAYRAIDYVLLRRNWLIGKRIHEEELKETRKENYGLKIIKALSEELTIRFGKGFNQFSLYRYLKFYTLYKNIFTTLSQKSLLSWSHYALLIKISDSQAREWYEKQALESSWSVRTLQRNIETQYYYRILASQNKQPIIQEMQQKTSDPRLSRLEHIKNPLILEFLGLSPNDSLLESALESAIISNLRKMLMELGKGYAFVGRQYRIQTEARDYYVDLVFYNYILKCFVLIDLKVGRIEHQDVGQMDMYVRMFDKLIKSESDNPTLGIVLCSETDADIARYSILEGNERLFASKYKLYLPNEETLKAEIEYQKELYYLTHEDEQTKETK